MNNHSRSAPPGQSGGPPRVRAPFSSRSNDPDELAALFRQLVEATVAGDSRTATAARRALSAQGWNCLQVGPRWAGAVQP